MINTGSFSLLPNEKRSVFFTFIPRYSNLILYDNYNKEKEKTIGREIKIITPAKVW